MHSPHILLTIQEICNTGAFASVYRANHHDGERTKQIALKILKEQWLQDQEQIHRFWDEAQLLTKLNHPNIVKAQGICELNGLPAIIMDFIDGFDLKLLLQNPVFQFSPKMSFEIACIIAKTLDEVYYHSQNQLGENLAVLHRDIKPSNIMINRHGLIQILDFGASRFENAERMGQTNLYEPGTQKYSPPDRRLGARGNHKGDIFAVGLLLIEMLDNQVIPIPPLQKDEYDRFLRYHIERLEFAMPNQQWVHSVKDTLYRMCAYDLNDRLNAKQAIHMLEPYAKRSQGLSLEQVIEHSFPQLPSEKKQGQLSGQSLQVQILRSLYNNFPNIEPNQQTGSMTSAGFVPEETAGNISITQKSTPTAKITINFFSHRIFWRNFALSAISFFLLLHFGTRIILSAKSSSPTASEKETQEQSKITKETPVADEIPLTIYKQDIALIEIFDQANNPIGKLSRSKSSQKLNLPKGTYSLSIKIFNHSAPHNEFSFSLEKESKLTCSLKDDKPFCQINDKK